MSPSLPTSLLFGKSGDKCWKLSLESSRRWSFSELFLDGSCCFFPPQKYDPFCYSWLEILFTLYLGCQNQNILTWMLKSGDVDTENKDSVTINYNKTTQIIWMCIDLIIQWHKYLKYTFEVMTKVLNFSRNKWERGFEGILLF